MTVCRAIVRAIPDTFAQALVRERPAEPIVVERARQQHRAYVETLEVLGVVVDVLPPLDGYPDCCFVEDCAIVADGVALIAQPGAPSRQGEEVTIAEALSAYVRLERMAVPATLDGGDCLCIGRHWYVGQSERTNAAGVRRVREVFEPLGFAVTEVPVGRSLHLKSVCSYLGDGWLLLAERSIPTDVFADVRVIPVPADEAYAANCLSVNGTVLMAAGFPVTRRAIEAAGFRVSELDTSEFRKADGSLTCLSQLCPLEIPGERGRGSAPCSSIARRHLRALEDTGRCRDPARRGFRMREQPPPRYDGSGRTTFVANRYAS